MIHAISRIWRRRSLRERITVASTALFAFAVVTGAVMLIELQQWSLVRAIDSSALKAANEISALVSSGRQPATVLAGGGGGDYIQIVDGRNGVESAQAGTDGAVSLLSGEQVAAVRNGQRLYVDGRSHGINDRLRVVGVPAGDETVIVATAMSRVEQAVHLLRTAAFVGAPFAVLVMALVTYWIVGRTLQPVAGLRTKAQEITAAGLADQRLPVPDAQDEIHRLAVTLNAMLDRLDIATTRQRTFVGDAAHELRSPIASARLQLEIAQRLGPSTDWDEVVSDVLTDVDRLQRLVDDLLALARSDESGGALRRREFVDVGELVRGLLPQYAEARVPIDVRTPDPPGTGDKAGPSVISGDPDALRRIVVNLIDNAVRYAATRVSVSVCQVTDPEPAVVLEVGDDGPGIAPDERQRVFDRFYRVAASRSRETGGTGLGLPIVRDLVRAHGGAVVLSGNQPHGLLATVTLPYRP